MHRSLLLLATIFGVCLLAVAFESGDGFYLNAANNTAEVSSTTLPGARPIIDAMHYPSIQAAIDTLPKEGGVVRIPPGEFNVLQPITIAQSDVLIEGCGTATHVKNTNTEGGPCFVIRSSNKGQKQWRVKLANMRITGNEESGHGIHADQTNEVFFDGVTVSYHGGHGIFLAGCYEDPRISDSLITYNKKDGLCIDKCHDIVVCGNQFEENKNAVTCRDSYNLCMTGNNLDDHLGNGVVIENTYGSVVSGNMIEECQGTGVILDRDCYGTTISANVIAHNFGGGIDLKDAHGCAVSANTFTLIPKRGLAIGPGSGRITVSANNFSDSFIGDGKKKRKKNDQAASGILLDGTADVAIVGNQFSGLSTPAIERTENLSRRIMVQANVVADAVSENDSKMK